MSVRRIPLTKGQFAIVDECDCDALISIGNWCYSSSGYAVHYQTDENGKRKTLFMHRVIMQRKLGHPLPASYQVDHISGAIQGNRARLDNRRSNLRLATHSQNQAAKGSQKNSTSGHKGINFRQGKWDVRLRYKRQRINLGRHDDFEKAKMVYRCAHHLLWGEFSTEQNVENVPSEIEQWVCAVLNQHGIVVSSDVNSTAA
ncbi:MAG: HNH endonuclease [Chloroflexi bacterium]|nr:HNH endonuclease [Chloroflexota bacterium]